MGAMGWIEYTSETRGVVSGRGLSVHTVPSEDSPVADPSLVDMVMLNDVAMTTPRGNDTVISAMSPSSTASSETMSSMATGQEDGEVSTGEERCRQERSDVNKGGEMSTREEKCQQEERCQQERRDVNKRGEMSTREEKCQQG